MITRRNSLALLAASGLLVRREALHHHMLLRLHALVEALGERFEILNTTIKKWSVGSPIQDLQVPAGPAPRAGHLGVRKGHRGVGADDPDGLLPLTHA